MRIRRRKSRSPNKKIKSRRTSAGERALRDSWSRLRFGRLVPLSVSQVLAIRQTVTSHSSTRHLAVGTLQHRSFALVNRWNSEEQKDRRRYRTATKLYVLGLLCCELCAVAFTYSVGVEYERRRMMKRRDGRLMMRVERRQEQESRSRLQLSLAEPTAGPLAAFRRQESST